jgi:Metallo-peptidase family M12/FlgD Ig-like domain
MEPAGNSSPRLVARIQDLRLAGLLAGALLTLAPALAHSAAPKLEAIQKNLGVARVSVQSLRFDSGTRQLPIDLHGWKVTLELEPVDLRAPGFRVLMQGADGQLREQTVDLDPTYRGSIPEIPGSAVGAMFRQGSLKATLALGDGRVFFVQPLSEIEPGSEPEQHAIYEGTDLLATGDEACATTELSVPVEPSLESGENTETAGLRIAELAFDTDFEYFNQNGGNYTTTVNDIQNIMSSVNAIYERDCEITHHLTLVIVRTTAADPYTSTDPGDMLDEFRAHWNASQTGVPRDVAHLMTGKNVDGGTIGIAAVGAVCNRSRAYGLSQTKFTTNMGRRVSLTAHELGHNWNADHCDGASPCYIMCSSVGGCDGLGLPSFEPVGIQAITSFAASRTCFGAPTAVDPSAPSNLIRLAAPSPSPFTGETTLRFYVERELTAELDVYDITGHRVARLADGVQSAGWHQVTWTGNDQDARRLGAGIYYARLRVGVATMTQKLVLLR